MRSRKFLLAIALAAGSALFGAAASAQTKPIKIGLITILSGPIASYGEAQKIMIDLAVEDINKAGGINGTPIEMQVEDAQLDPAQAALLYRKLASDGAVAIIGPFTTTQLETVTPLAPSQQLVVVSATSGAPGKSVRPWVWRLGPVEDTVLPRGLDAFARVYPNAKRWALVIDGRESNFRIVADLLAQEAVKRKLEILERIEFSTRTTDLSPIAIKVKQLDPDAVYFAGLTPSALALVKEFAQQSVDKPVLANSALWTSGFVSTAGNNASNWYTPGFSTNTETLGDQTLYASVVKRFLERASTKPGIGDNIGNQTVSYDVALLYADILRRAKLNGSVDTAKLREVVKDGMLALKDFRGLNQYQMRDTGDGDTKMGLLKVDSAKGAWVYAQRPE
jgi:branched-chain amino acid transport system substrate-binding protein